MHALRKSGPDQRLEMVEPGGVEEERLGAGPERLGRRMCSAFSDPPGSRVAAIRWPSASSRLFRRAIWVDLPAPSPPSKVMKRPRISRGC